MYSYETSTEALDDLKNRGFKTDFNRLEQDRLDNAKIIETYRFEGITSPEDEEILFAIELQSGEKGTLVSAYGTYADTNSAIVRKLVIL